MWAGRVEGLNKQATAGSWIGKQLSAGMLLSLLGLDQSSECQPFRPLRALWLTPGVPQASPSSM